jgi:CheY-like chemotaxis protein
MNEIEFLKSSCPTGSQSHSAEGGALRNPARRILVADDDPNITAALTARLTACGYEVLTAANGFDALKLIVTKKPALVLMDIWMPTGLGFSVAERMKAHGLSIPIIFITASHMNGLRAAAKQVGASGFLEKPYDPAQLMETIEQTLTSAASPAL